MAAALFEHDDAMGRLGEPVDRTEWELPAHIVNAYYHPLLNEIVFTAGILQPPFFDPEADDAVNYGGIGTVIGHEITHGFDDAGSRFDARRRACASGGPSPTAPSSSVGRRCSSTSSRPTRWRTACTSTDGSRWARTSRTWAGWPSRSTPCTRPSATDAPAIDGFTPEQRFFLAYATIWRTNYTDEYARMLATRRPALAGLASRTNGPLANFPPFAAAFDLPEGAPMVRPPELRAEIW